MAQGDPFTAVRMYEQVVTEHPGDPQLWRELSEARRAAGAELATRADEAMSRTRYELAVTLAGQAAEYDPAHRQLEIDARHLFAEQLLMDAESALSDGRFAAARKSAEHAHSVAHDLPAARTMLDRITYEETGILAAQARELAEAGDFERAIDLSRRAQTLRPADSELASLSSTINQAERESRFDSLAVLIKADLNAGRMTGLPERLAKLEALGVRSNELAALQASFADRAAGIEAALGDARAARLVGQFDEARGYFTKALSLVSDRPDIEAELAACRIDQRVAAALRDGRLAFQQGEYDEAARHFGRANDIRPSAQTTGWLNQTRAEQYRQSFAQALEAENLPLAASQLEHLLRYEPDPDGDAQLAQLRGQIVDDAIAEASQLYAADRLDEAVDSLDAALRFATDQRASQLRADLKAEALLRDAVAAELAGDYRKARKAYLDSMAQGGDRQNVSQRIDDLEALAEMQELLEQSEAESESIRNELASTLSSLADLQSDYDIMRRVLEAREAENEELRERLIELQQRLRR